MAKTVQRLAVLIRTQWRKLLVAGIFAFVLLGYFTPWLKEESKRYLILGPIDRCLEDRVKDWKIRRSLQDAFIFHSSGSKEKYFLPYVGNGYIGISTDGRHGVWLKGERGLDIPTDFIPLGHFNIKGYDRKEVTVLDIIGGRVLKIQCFQENEAKFSPCITFTHEVYVHRTRPGLLVQELTVNNPSNRDIEIAVTQDSISDWATDHAVVNLDDLSVDGSLWLYGSKELANSVLLTVAGMQISPSGLIELPANRQKTLRSLTVFDYVPLKDGLQETIAKRKEHTVKALGSALKISKQALDTEHEQAWNKLWRSGFSISESKAPEALNGDVINSTLYYILSHVPSVIEAVTSEPEEIAKAYDMLNSPESCYNNRHHTLQFSSLWQIGDTVESMNRGVDTHLKTLEQYGCANYIQAGAEGVIQAILLSLGSLKFMTVNKKVLHMEFNADPADLHRDYEFRQIRYANLSYINVSVIVDENNFPVLHVSAESKGFYACDASLTEFTPLSKEKVTLPVKLTKPLTSILYVAYDKQHLEDMRQVVQHVELPKLAPAHDHRLIAMHKHGHSFGGLPLFFWVLLVLLIVIFHVFLIKMVISEYCKSDVTPYRRRAFS